MNRLRWLGPILVAALLVPFAGPAAAKKPTTSPKVDFVLTVLHVNDGESDLLPDADGAGSISRFGWLLDDLRTAALTSAKPAKAKSGVVTVTAGDNFLASPELEASFDRGAFYDADALGALGFDAFVIGNHEFDFGPDVLADFIEDFGPGGAPFLSANLDFSAEPRLQALVDAGRIASSTVVKERGERIGIVGATTPELYEVSSPGNTVVDPDVVAAVQAEVDALTASGVDKILLASHLQDLDNELALVPLLRDVDAVIGGGGGESLGDAYPLVATDAGGSEVPVVTVPGDYFDIGRLVLEFDRDGNVTGYGGALEAVSGDLPQDASLLDNVEAPVAAFLAELGATVIGTSEVGLNGVRGDVRTRETNLGNLMADGHLVTGRARAAAFGVPEPDIALQNGGGIRNDSVFPPGDVSLLQTFDAAPFTNFVAVLPDVARADVVAAVEHGLAGLPGAAGSFAQWAGLVVVYDASAPSGSRVVDLALADGTSIVTGGALQPGDPITIATIDFLAAGNDGYDMFESYDFVRVGVSYQQSLADLISALGTLTAADYADPVATADRTRIVPA